MMDKLTKQDQDFVREVAITGNQTQAAKNAYGITSDDYARKKGSVQVAKGNINTAIQEVKRSIAESIPDELLAEKHLALLHKQEVITKNNSKTGEIEVIPTGEIDTTAVRSGLDMAYKLKGSYAPDKQLNLDINVDITNPEAIRLAQEYEEKLKKGL